MTQSNMSIERLVDSFKASRESFSIAFNQFANDPSSGVSRFETISIRRNAREPIVSTQDRTSADVRAALEIAEANGFLNELCARSGDFLFNAKNSGLIIPASAAPDASSRQSIELSYQAIVSAEPFRDPNAITAGLMSAQRRTCRILVRQGQDRITGTGFLIGPRLILTNWHVVQSLLSRDSVAAVTHGTAADQGWEMRKESAPSLSVEFDFTVSSSRGGGVKRIGASSNWLVAASSSEGHEHGAHNGAAFIIPEPQKLDEFTDFAIIELAEPAGLHRGYYDILNQEPSLPGGNMIVLHHPGEFSMRLSTGSFDVDSAHQGLLGNSSIRSRALHTANTFGGSSGGLCLNWSMEPVALHQAGIIFNEPVNLTNDGGNALKRAAVNIAIPLGQIRAKALDALEKRMGELKALVPVLSSGKPLVGRVEFQETVASARKGTTKIIIVRPDLDNTDRREPLKGVGKSFSKEIMEEVLDPASHVVIQLNASSLLGPPYETAKALLSAVDPRIADTLPAFKTLSDPMSTEVVDIIPRLTAIVREKLLEAASGRTLWLVIDDLDKHSIPDHSTRALLSRLYVEIDDTPALRLVLLGLQDVDLPSLQAVKAKSVGKPLTHLDKLTVDEWIARRAEGVVTMPDAARLCLASMVMSSAMRRASVDFSITQAVAEVIRNDVDPHLRAGTE